MNDNVSRATFQRLEDLMREMGTLLLAFAPLEGALSSSPSRWFSLVFFLVLGAALFAAAVRSERRRIRVA